MAVLPTLPRMSPVETASPTSTVGTEARLAYTLVIPPPWSTTTVVPIITSEETSLTVPEATERTSVPALAEISTPVWVRQSAMVGS